jgi:hypothetical protein
MMPMRGELSIPVARVGNPVGLDTGRTAADVILTPELLKVSGVCLLGLAITLLLIYLSPNAGELIQAFNVYP